MLFEKHLNLNQIKKQAHQTERIEEERDEEIEKELQPSADASDLVVKGSEDLEVKSSGRAIEIWRYSKFMN